MSRYSGYVPDSKGIAKILKSPGVRAAVDALAAEIAANVDPQYPTKVGTYTTDRAAAGVTIENAYSLADEAKKGVLTVAAAAAGHEVRSKKK